MIMVDGDEKISFGDNMENRESREEKGGSVLRS